MSILDHDAFFLASFPLFQGKEAWSEWLQQMEACSGTDTTLAVGRALVAAVVDDDHAAVEWLWDNQPPPEAIKEALGVVVMQGNLPLVAWFAPRVPEENLEGAVTAAVMSSTQESLDTLLAHRPGTTSGAWNFENGLFLAIVMERSAMVDRLWALSSEDVLVQRIQHPGVSIHQPTVIDHLANRWTPENAALLLNAYGPATLPVLASVVRMRTDRALLNEAFSKDTLRPGPRLRV